MNDSLVFYKSFYDALREFKPGERAQVYDAIFQYVFDGKEPELRGGCKAAWILIRPQLDANIRRRENGFKGGRPKAKVTEKETNGFEEDETKTKPMVTETENQTETEPKANVNVNVNVNDNANVNVKERVTRAREEKKHRFGRYQNVLLSDDDLEKLKAEFPDWEQRIENLSEGIACKEYTYKNHLAVIRKWARKDAEVKPQKAKSSQKDFIQGNLSDDLDLIEQLTFRRAK